MTHLSKTAAFVALAAAITLTMWFKGQRGSEGRNPTRQEVVGPSAPASRPAVPRLVCLGAGKCVPCRAMEPVREELRAEYHGRLVVEFHDVWIDRNRADEFGVRIIPTSVFYDADGRELERTEGFIGKEDILARFAKHGVRF
jgi:thioredoxin 1